MLDIRGRFRIFEDFDTMTTILAVRCEYNGKLYEARVPLSVSQLEEVEFPSMQSGKTQLGD